MRCEKKWKNLLNQQVHKVHKVHKVIRWDENRNIDKYFKMLLYWNNSKID